MEDTLEKYVSLYDSMLPNEGVGVCGEDFRIAAAQKLYWCVAARLYGEMKADIVLSSGAFLVDGNELDETILYEEDLENSHLERYLFHHFYSSMDWSVSLGSNYVNSDSDFGSCMEEYMEHARELLLDIDLTDELFHIMETDEAETSLQYYGDYPEMPGCVVYLVSERLARALHLIEENPDISGSVHATWILKLIDTMCQCFTCGHLVYKKGMSSACIVLYFENDISYSIYQRIPPVFLLLGPFLDFCIKKILND